MKTILYSLVILFLISCTSVKSSDMPESDAVIELFTSQGCSSCPPADKLLAQTIANATRDGRKIYALSFHVDYWNHLGWADPFSDKKYSDRQGEYASHLSAGLYTPQMIVNGSKEFVGSDENALDNALNQALSTRAIATFKNIQATQGGGKPWHVHYELDGDFANSVVNFAMVSLHETTSVKRGENKDHVLKNENVVRQFVSAKALSSGEIDFALSPAPDPGNMEIIGFVQRTIDLKISGAALAVLK